MKHQAAIIMIGGGGGNHRAEENIRKTIHVLRAGKASKDPLGMQEIEDTTLLFVTTARR